MLQTSDKSIIISEILDSRTRNLVSVSRINDYVLSNEFVSMTLVMVAEDKKISRVLEELFSEEVCTYYQFLILPMVCLCHEICVRTNIGSSELHVINVYSAYYEAVFSIFLLFL